MTAPTEAEIREEILAAALRGSPDGQTMRELEALGREHGLGRRRVHDAIRALVGSGRVQVVTNLQRKDIAGRDQLVIGYRFLGMEP